MAKKKKFTVYATVVHSICFEMPAKDEDEAYDKAEEFYNSSDCKVDDDSEDEFEVTSVEEIE